MDLYFWIIWNIIGSCGLLLSLYERIYAGKFILKTKRKKISLIYTIPAVLWGYATVRRFFDYFGGREVDIYAIFQGLLWIQLCILLLLGRLSLGIAEGGIYSENLNFSCFTKWGKVKSYTWISDNIIQFETLTRKGRISNTELEVSLEQKEEVDKLLKDNLNKTDREVNKKINFKLKVLIALITVVLVIGNVSLIKISKPYMTEKIKLKEDEAVAILKKTWKPLAELNKENIRSREEFDKLFQETMTKPIIDDLYEILVDTNKSIGGEIRFKEKVRIPTIYDTKMSIEKSYIKSPKYKEENKRSNEEELIIEELVSLDKDGQISSFIRESTFIRNDNGNWILHRITGLQSIGSP
ncbi:DUF5673 domain-containing protein [Clostridium peptidivorans]|uniref:DUF5673 domain-containing protein n=1 Tax=Clostridium peptidivorans TaxID=100174 RepID=UPI000BE27109|nr:DUF5673 domain-containing protein [Clostridium peptidivorans]